MNILFVLSFIIGLLSSCSVLDKIEIKVDRQRKSVFNPVWIKSQDPKYNSGNLPIALQSPLINEGIVYIGHNDGLMRAFQLSDGREIWNQKDNGAYHAGPMINKDDLIYGTVEGRVYSRNRSSGKLNWNIDLGAAIESEGVVSKGRLYFHTRNHKVFCLDLKTGKILWAYKRSVPYMTTLQRVSRPLAYRNKLYVGFADGMVAAFSIEEGILLWETKIANGAKFIDVDSAPLVFKNKLIMGSLSGPLTVLNMDNGFIERRVDYNVARRPFVFGKKLFLGTTDGELVVLDQNLNKLNELKLGEGAISSIVEWKGGLAVSDVEGHLYFVDAKTFKQKETYFLGHSSSAVFGRLVAHEKMLAVYSSRNRLYLFK